MKVLLLLVSWLTAFAVCFTISGNRVPLCVTIISEGPRSPHTKYSYHATVTKGKYFHNGKRVEVGSEITVGSFFCPLTRNKQYSLEGTPSGSTLYTVQECIELERRMHECQP